MILQAFNLTKCFNKHKILDNISFNLKKGEITGLVGTNGSGKTTLLKILSGIYNADSGKFKIMGNTLSINPKQIENLAFMPDRFDYFNYHKVSEIPDFYKIIYPNFDDVFFYKELKRHNIMTDANIRDFSKGTKNLIGLISVLASNAKIILADEVLDGMDILNKRNISEYLLDAKNNGCTILISSHELAELSGLCENILYITTDGKLITFGDENTSNLKKIQLVVKDDMPFNILDNSVLISNMGRVYTLLFDLDDKKLAELLSDEKIVQYDNLEVKIEDYFYFEKGVCHE